MLKWKYSDADTICDGAEQTQTMNHLIKCPMLPQECATEDVMEYNETEKECVFQWMNNVSHDKKKNIDQFSCYLDDVQKIYVEILIYIYKK